MTSPTLINQIERLNTLLDHMPKIVREHHQQRKALRNVLKANEFMLERSRADRRWMIGLALLVLADDFGLWAWLFG